MKKLPFFLGVGMMMTQAVIAGIYYLVTASVSVATFNFWALMAILIPFNFVSIAMVLYGLFVEE